MYEMNIASILPSHHLCYQFPPSPKCLCTRIKIYAQERTVCHQFKKKIYITIFVWKVSVQLSGPVLFVRNVYKWGPRTFRLWFCCMQSLQSSWEQDSLSYIENPRFTPNVPGCLLKLKHWYCIIYIHFICILMTIFNHSVSKILDI